MTVTCRALFGIRVLSDNQQGYVGYDIEDEEDDFEQSKERVNEHIEGFPWKGEKPGLGAVYQIGCEYAHCGPEDEQGPINYSTPHKKGF